MPTRRRDQPHAEVIIVFPTGCAVDPVTFTCPTGADPQCPTVLWRTPSSRRTATRRAGHGDARRRVTHDRHRRVGELSDAVFGQLDSETNNSAPVLSSPVPRLSGPAPRGDRPHFGAQPHAALRTAIHRSRLPGSQGCRRSVRIGKEPNAITAPAEITVTATVTPAAGKPGGADAGSRRFAARLQDHQIAQFQLTGTGIRTRLANRDRHVSAPPGCGPFFADFHRRACPRPPDDDDDDGRGWGCIIGRWSSRCCLGSPSSLFFVWVCFPAAGPPVLDRRGRRARARLDPARTGLAFARRAWRIPHTDVANRASSRHRGDYISAAVPGCSGWGLACSSSRHPVHRLGRRRRCKPTTCEVAARADAAFVIGAATALDLLATSRPCAISIVPTIVGIIAGSDRGDTRAMREQPEWRIGRRCRRMRSGAKSRRCCAGRFQPRLATRSATPVLPRRRLRLLGVETDREGLDDQDGRPRSSERRRRWNPSSRQFAEPDVLSELSLRRSINAINPIAHIS